MQCPTQCVNPLDICCDYYLCCYVVLGTCNMDYGHYYYYYLFLDVRYILINEFFCCYRLSECQINFLGKKRIGAMLRL